MPGPSNIAVALRVRPGFLFAFGLALACIGLVAYPLGTAYWYTNLGSPDADWVNDLHIRKEAALAAADSPRVLFVGGSGCLFTIDAELISERLGKPAVNLCSHAGVALEYFLAYARRHARPGDSVVIVAEHRVLFRKEPEISEIKWKYFTTWDRGHYWEHGLLGALRTLYRIPLRDLAAVKHERTEVNKGNITYPAYRMSPAGDMRLRMSITPTRLTNLPDLFVLPSPAADRLVREFTAWARGRGVSVYAVPEATSLAPADYPLTNDLFALKKTWWGDRGVTLLVPHEDGRLPPDLFQDTAQHGGAGLQYVWSNHVADALLDIEVKARDILLLPSHPVEGEPFLRTPPKGARAMVYSTSEERNWGVINADGIARAMAGGARVYVGAPSLRVPGYEVTTLSSKRETEADVVKRHAGDVILRCPPAAAPTELSTVLRTAVVETYRVRIESANGLCSILIDDRDLAAPWPHLQFRTLDAARGILTGVYQFDADGTVLTEWLGELHRQ